MLTNRLLYTVVSPDGLTAAVTMDLDAFVTLDGSGCNHPSEMRDHSDLRERMRPLVLQGWQDGATQASALSSVLAGEVPAVASIRQRWEYGPEGEELVAERALDGDWDVAYRRPVRRKVLGTRIVTLAAQFGGRAHRSAQELFWTGAQLVAACDVLEAAGYKVEAHAINFARYEGRNSEGWFVGRSLLGALDVIVKRPEHPMRPDVLMAATAHADVYRSFGFTGKCYFPQNFDVDDMGATVDKSAEAVSDALAKVEEHGLLPHIDNFMPHAYSREQAVTNVLAVLHSVTGGNNV